MWIRYHCHWLLLVLLCFWIAEHEGHIHKLVIGVWTPNARLYIYKTYRWRSNKKYKKEARIKNECEENLWHTKNQLSISSLIQILCIWEKNVDCVRHKDSINNGQKWLLLVCLFTLLWTSSVAINLSDNAVKLQQTLCISRQ